MFFRPRRPGSGSEALQLSASGGGSYSHLRLDAFQAAQAPGGNPARPIRFAEPSAWRDPSGMPWAPRKVANAAIPSARCEQRQAVLWLTPPLMELKRVRGAHIVLQS